MDADARHVEACSSQRQSGEGPGQQLLLLVKAIRLPNADQQRRLNDDLGRRSGTLNESYGFSEAANDRTLVFQRQTIQGETVVLLPIAALLSVQYDDTVIRARVKVQILRTIGQCSERA